MSLRLRSFIFFALLVVMPVQGIAAAIGPLLCLTGGGHGHIHAAVHVHHAHDSGAHHAHGETAHHDRSDQTGAGDFAGHLCCQLTAPAVPGALHALPRSDPPLFEPTLSLLETLYIPERPQRPPRA